MTTEIINYKIQEKQTYSPLCQKHTQSQTWRDVEPVHRGPHLLHGDKQELKKDNVNNQICPVDLISAEIDP